MTMSLQSQRMISMLIEEKKSTLEDTDNYINKSLQATRTNDARLNIEMLKLQELLYQVKRSRSNPHNYRSMNNMKSNSKYNSREASSLRSTSLNQNYEDKLMNLKNNGVALSNKLKVRSPVNKSLRVLDAPRSRYASNKNLANRAYVYASLDEKIVPRDSSALKDTNLVWKDPIDFKSTRNNLAEIQRMLQETNNSIFDESFRNDEFRPLPPVKGKHKISNRNIDQQKATIRDKIAGTNFIESKLRDTLRRDELKFHKKTISMRVSGSNFISRKPSSEVVIDDLIISNLRQTPQDIRYGSPVLSTVKGRGKDSNKTYPRQVSIKASLDIPKQHAVEDSLHIPSRKLLSEIQETVRDDDIFRDNSRLSRTHNETINNEILNMRMKNPIQFLNPKVLVNDMKSEKKIVYKDSRKASLNECELRPTISSDPKKVEIKSKPNLKINIKKYEGSILESSFSDRDSHRSLSKALESLQLGDNQEQQERNSKKQANEEMDILLRIDDVLSKKESYKSSKAKYIQNTYNANANILEPEELHNHMIECEKEIQHGPQILTEKERENKQIGETRDRASLHISDPSYKGDEFNNLHNPKSDYLENSIKESEIKQNPSSELVETENLRSDDVAEKDVIKLAHQNDQSMTIKSKGDAINIQKVQYEKPQITPNQNPSIISTERPQLKNFVKTQARVHEEVKVKSQHKNKKDLEERSQETPQEEKIEDIPHGTLRETNHTNSLKLMMENKEEIIEAKPDKIVLNGLEEKPQKPIQDQQKSKFNNLELVGEDRAQISNPDRDESVSKRSVSFKEKEENVRVGNFTKPEFASPSIKGKKYTVFVKRSTTSQNEEGEINEGSIRSPIEVASPHQFFNRTSKTNSIIKHKSRVDDSDLSEGDLDDTPHNIEQLKMFNFVENIKQNIYDPQELILNQFVRKTSVINPIKFSKQPLKVRV